MDYNSPINSCSDLTNAPRILFEYTTFSKFQFVSKRLFDFISRKNKYKKSTKLKKNVRNSRSSLATRSSNASLNSSSAD
ncbi:hypothetical protein BpHYR1_000160 [Brachionus plicatilis]|uniref:Uncharacterized protein n=1 Tax=Brachionus plicatilis TaxID=10195 RepID=A0A3M7PEB5_BRAPC|nr:hypothetical protein BpHYR1_000160 [Brachionus plicatilis]